MKKLQVRLFTTITSPAVYFPVHLRGLGTSMGSALRALGNVSSGWLVRTQKTLFYKLAMNAQYGRFGGAPNLFYTDGDERPARRVSRSRYRRPRWAPARRPDAVLRVNFDPVVTWETYNGYRTERHRDPSGAYYYDISSSYPEAMLRGAP